MAFPLGIFPSAVLLHREVAVFSKRRKAGASCSRGRRVNLDQEIGVPKDE